MVRDVYSAERRIESAEELCGGINGFPIPIHTSIVLISAIADSKALQNISGIQFSLNGGHSMFLHQRRRRVNLETTECYESCNVKRSRANV